MDIGDLFGQTPNRPDHPDFWKLSEIILKYDGAIEAATTNVERDEAWDLIVKEVGIHEKSLAYVASQRAMRALGVATPQDLKSPAIRQILPRMAAVYMEAFMIGARFNQSKTT